MNPNELRKFLIDRFDHYYDSIHNKGNLFLAINTFLIGGLFATMVLLPTYLNQVDGAIFCIVTMLALNITSLIFTLLSLIPYSRTCGKSLVYFGDISKMDIDTFLKEFSNQTDEKLSTDLSQQVYFLAKGLSKKYRNLYIAGIIFFIEAMVLVPLLINVLINLK